VDAAILPNVNVRINRMHGEQGYTQGTPYWASDMFNGCVFLGFAVTSAIALARCVQLNSTRWLLARLFLIPVQRLQL
jgi:hypothetical protein